MGANLRTWLLSGSRLDEVEPAVSAWMSAKGFEREASPSPVWPSQMGGRGVLLAENDRGVVIAYSDAWTEGERLVFELKRLRPILLECWLHDSDIWGYRLHREGEVVAAFCSNPRYFGGESHDEDAVRLGRNGDARLLTATLGMPEKEQTLRDLQIRKRIFAEELTEQFAELVEAPALALDYQDWLEYGVHATDGVRTLGDHRVRGVVYLPRDEGEGGRWNLHAVPARKLAPPDMGDFPPEAFAIPESTLWMIALFRALALPIGLLLRVATIPLMIAIRLRPQLVLGRLSDGMKAMEASPLRRALHEAAAEQTLRAGEADTGKEGEAEATRASGFVQDGDRYVHRRFGFSLTPAPGVTVASPARADLCTLQAGEQTGTLMPQSFDMFETMLGNLPGEPVEDLKETVDGLPLRMIVCDLAGGPQAAYVAALLAARKRQQKKRGWRWFGRRRDEKPDEATADSEAPRSYRLFYAAVQEKRFVYLLTMQLLDADDQTLDALKATMRSFRRIEAPPASSGSPS